MDEFLKSVRRKLGALTLAMACLLSADWFRSYSMNDTISIPISHTKYFQVASSNQHLIFGSVFVTPIDGDGKERLPLWMANEAQSTPDKDQQWRFVELDGGYSIRFQPSIGMGRWGELRRTLSNQFEIVYRYVGTVYWWFVLPLTLLSAWLLLSKPRIKQYRISQSRSLDRDRRQKRDNSICDN